jgi:hypothetical protein
VAAADRMRSEPHICARFGAAGRAYAENAFNISGVADRFEAMIAKARRLDRGRRSPRSSATPGEGAVRLAG